MEQQALYSRASSGQSKYPAALPGTSLHEWGLACDIDVQPHSALFVVGPVFEKVGLGTWGGHFSQPDEIHFEAGPDLKKLCGWVKGAVYEPGLEPAWNPLEALLPSPSGVLGWLLQIPMGQVEDWLSGILS
jgi:hypothetical protein